MPLAADVVLLIRLLAHLRDLGVSVHLLEEAVDVDVSPAAREGYVLLGRQRLVAEKDDAVVVIGPADLGELRVAELATQIHAVDLGAHALDGGLTSMLSKTCAITSIRGGNATKYALRRLAHQRSLVEYRHRRLQRRRVWQREPHAGERTCSGAVHM